jgi:hypothetical protein
MKRYKYQALVRLFAARESGCVPALPGPACRMVVRARHHETHAGKLFSALVAASSDRMPGGGCVIVTVTVLGDDARDYLAAGAEFTLWRGGDIGHGVVTRRVFV